MKILNFLNLVLLASVSLAYNCNNLASDLKKQGIKTDSMSCVMNSNNIAYLYVYIYI